MDADRLFAGSQLRRARVDRGLSQAAAAARLGLSASYYNQLEHDRRPLSAAVLDRVWTAFRLDPGHLATDAGGRLLAELHDAMLAAAADPVPAADLRELARSQPIVAQTIIQLYRRWTTVTDQLAHAAAGDPDPSSVGRSVHEDVRDFFYRRRNHIPELESAAERTVQRWRLQPATLEADLRRLLATVFGVTVRDTDATGAVRRRFDPEHRDLLLPAGLTPARRSFQCATQLALLEHGPLIDSLVAADPELDSAAAPLARIGLAHYFAGAVVLPYDRFLALAERHRYDIEILCHIYGVGFETVCHRLSTLQRPSAPGVPFFFVRTDRAGNISKRQSATAFHFSRTGGSCPLWIVHAAFDTPGRIRRQIAQMPDGRTYLWVARTVGHRALAFGEPSPEFAIGLGCDIRHADRLVYSDGLSVGDPRGATPIGPGCRTCERSGCRQRAFPLIGRVPVADPNTATGIPYE